MITSQLLSNIRQSNDNASKASAY